MRSGISRFSAIRAYETRPATGVDESATGSMDRSLAEEGEEGTGRAHGIGNCTAFRSSVKRAATKGR